MPMLVYQRVYTHQDDKCLDDKKLQPDPPSALVASFFLLHQVWSHFCFVTSKRSALKDGCDFFLDRISFDWSLNLFGTEFHRKFAFNTIILFSEMNYCRNKENVLNNLPVTSCCWSQDGHMMLQSLPSQLRSQLVRLAQVAVDSELATETCCEWNAMV